MLDQKSEIGDAERAEIEATAAVYVGAGKAWRREDYRIEHRGPRDDGRCWAVWAVHAGDEGATAPDTATAPGPGGGQSLELWIDRKSKRVVKELGFQ